MWHSRAVAEHLATAQFHQLAQSLESPCPDLAQLALEAADDELRHRDLCAEMATRYGAPAPKFADAAPIDVAPHGISTTRRTIYRSVAMCCLSETLNATLLRRTVALATDPATLTATRVLLGDEVRHAQLGWAILSRDPDPTWLAPWLTSMLEGTVPLQERSALFAPSANPTRVAHGVFGGPILSSVLQEGLEQVVLPGLEHFGVDTAPARDWLTDLFDAAE